MATVLAGDLKRNMACHNSTAAELTACRHRRTAKPPKQTLAKPAAKYGLRPASPNLPGAALAAKCPPTNWAKSGRNQRKKKFKKKSRAKPIACKIKGSPENFATLLDPPGPQKFQKKSAQKRPKPKEEKKRKKNPGKANRLQNQGFARNFRKSRGPPRKAPNYQKSAGSNPA